MSHDFRQIAPTDHFGWHACYLELFERLFHSLRYVEGSVGEWGCDGAGGILTYCDWFERNSECARNYITCDISPRPSSLANKPGIVHLQGNAYSPEGVARMRQFAPFACQVEDGPHDLGSQRFFVENYPHLLAARGLAILEDIQSPEHVPILIGALPQGFIGMSVDMRIADSRYDSLVLLIIRA